MECFHFEKRWFVDAERAKAAKEEKVSDVEQGSR
jgi:hypothetical protein